MLRTECDRLAAERLNPQAHASRLLVPLTLVRTPSRARRCSLERDLTVDRVDDLLAVDHVLEVPNVVT